MFTLATILDNPGEPAAETQYRDPQLLRELGYNGLVIYSTTGISGLLAPDTISSQDIRRWVTDQFDTVEKSVREARAAGLGVWLTYDAPSLAKELIGSAMTCIKNPDTLCPASDELLDMSAECLDALISRMGPIDGIVLRLGDNDAHRIPYLIGNDIYSPHCSRCSNLGRADRLVKYIRFFYEKVVEQMGLRLIIRGWNLRPRGLHDDADLCQRVMEQLPVDDRLIMSFKFTQTDFWRYQRWNPSSLVCGERPIIYELECQREFEGKGAFPNYQASLWRDGPPEIEPRFGLAEASKQVNLAGLWAWVRGGGWGGPFVKDETWIDANVVAVPQLAANPQADPEALARAWINDRLQIHDSAGTEAVLKALTHSAQSVLETFYVGPYARSKVDAWYPAGHFIQDDNLDAEAAWALLQRLPDSVLDEVLHEKQQAVERISRDRAALQRTLAQGNHKKGAILAHTMEYTESLAETIRNLFAGLISYRRHGRRGDPKQAGAAMDRLLAAQHTWNHHTQRVASYPGTASAFRSENLWDFTQNLIDHLHKQS